MSFCYHDRESLLAFRITVDQSCVPFVDDDDDDLV